MAQGFNIFITRALLKWERRRRTATDGKLQKTSEFVGAIRHLRWYGWQQFWLDQIMKSRQHELYLRVVTSLWGMLIGVMNNLASGMFPVVAFYAYTELAGQPLRIDIAFPALQLFGMLEMNLREIPNLITMLLNAKIAVGRIEDFMCEPDKDENNTVPEIEETQLAVHNGSFTWPGLSQLVLYDINVNFPVGLTVIWGKVAAGKTALLQALLGELDARGGSVTRSNETIGYCAQTPWLQSMSIRENILFSSPYDDARYKRVLDACALIPDLASFKHGDLSNIGENGIGLSGGQKARVALARAIYSRANVLLLDDPLSALDHQTAEIIVRKCFRGPLLEKRIAVLVTHRTALCHDVAEQIIEVADGRVQLDRESIFSTQLDKVQSSDSANGPSMKRNEEQDLAAVPEKFIEDEYRAHGGVKAKVYWEYIKAGKIRWWAVLVFFLAFRRLAGIGRTWFLKAWGEAYNRPSELNASGLFDSLPSPEANVRPWLLGFFIFAMAQTVMFMIVQATMIVIIYTAGRQMFEDVMNRVSNATFRFYDVTPIGRLMNRLTSDIGTVDGNISRQFQAVAFLSIFWVSSIVVIASVTPIFLVFSLALTAAFVLIFMRFLPTSQSLRRLEMVSLTPLMSNFGALLEGLTTVRAFGAQSRFQDRVIAVTDTFQKMDHFYWSLQAWLMYRFDTLSACSTFVLTMLALYTGVSPGLTAFVLIAAAQFVDSTHGICRQYGQLQMEFVSVERVVEMLHIDQEPKGNIDPPAAWPSYTGEIIFEDVTIRYAPHLDPSLSNLSFRIPGGSTTALLGRTGSGKSTLALSLLASTLPESGRILIDGIDISTVSTHALRNRVTFLAQDPVLFPGTMRQNLDPLGEHPDEACDAVLQRIAATHQWTIDTPVDAGGKNMSQGQRQLVGLARAILRRSAVVILDEATASIDTETAMQIQQVLRDEMKESTVITIAHRLEAVRGADYYIRLDQGRMIAQGHPTGETMSGGGTD